MLRTVLNFWIGSIKYCDDMLSKVGSGMAFEVALAGFLAPFQSVFSITDEAPTLALLDLFL